MKKLIIAAAMLFASSSAFAVAPGGPNCGWGNMLFEGSNGLVIQILAITTNNISGNRTFGMTTGTNGCSADGTLTYGGDSMLSMTGSMDEVAHDMAQGHGEALTALAASLGVQQQDRGYFDQTMQQHFAVIFPSDDVTAGQAMNNILHVMEQDQRLQQYAS